METNTKSTPIGKLVMFPISEDARTGFIVTTACDGWEFYVKIKEFKMKTGNTVGLGGWVYSPRTQKDEQTPSLFYLSMLPTDNDKGGVLRVSLTRVTNGPDGKVQFDDDPSMSGVLYRVSDDLPILRGNLYEYVPYEQPKQPKSKLTGVPF